MRLLKQPRKEIKELSHFEIICSRCMAEFLVELSDRKTFICDTTRYYVDCPCCNERITFPSINTWDYIDTKTRMFDNIKIYYKEKEYNYDKEE